MSYGWDMSYEELEQQNFDLNVMNARDKEELDYVVNNNICWQYDRDEYWKNRHNGND